jgi:hypothetical protein
VEDVVLAVVRSEQLHVLGHPVGDGPELPGHLIGQMMSIRKRRRYVEAMAQTVRQVAASSCRETVSAFSLGETDLDSQQVGLAVPDEPIISKQGCI